MYGLEYAHALVDLKEVTESLLLSHSIPIFKINYAEVVGSVLNPSGDCTTDNNQVGLQCDSTTDAKFTDDGDEQYGNGRRMESASYGLGGLIWNIPSPHKIEDYLLFWIGQDNTAFTNVILTFNNCEIGKLLCLLTLLCMQSSNFFLLILGLVRIFILSLFP